MRVSLQLIWSTLAWPERCRCGRPAWKLGKPPTTGKGEEGGGRKRAVESRMMHRKDMAWEGILLVTLFQPTDLFLGHPIFLAGRLAGGVRDRSMG